MKAERDVQYLVVVYAQTARRLPKVAVALIESAAHLKIPLEFAKYCPFSSANYVLKHQQTKIVYFNIPIYIQMIPFGKQ